MNHPAVCLHDTRHPHPHRTARWSWRLPASRRRCRRPIIPPAAVACPNYLASQTPTCHPEVRAISASTRVFDALWGAPRRMAARMIVPSELRTKVSPHPGSPLRFAHGSPTLPLQGRVVAAQSVQACERAKPRRSAPVEPQTPLPSPGGGGSPSSECEAAGWGDFLQTLASAGTNGETSCSLTCRTGGWRDAHPPS